MIGEPYPRNLDFDAEILYKNFNHEADKLKVTRVVICRSSSAFRYWWARFDNYQENKFRGELYYWRFKETARKPQMRKQIEALLDLLKVAGEVEGLVTYEGETL